MNITFQTTGMLRGSVTLNNHGRERFQSAVGIQSGKGCRRLNAASCSCVSLNSHCDGTGAPTQPSTSPSVCGGEEGSGMLISCLHSARAS
jgi:hypothetical protein